MANVLLAREQLTPNRIRVTGLADTEPRVPNTSPENRARNRRVEIVIDLSEPMQEQELRLLELIHSEKETQEAIIGIEPGQNTPNEITW